MSRTTDQYQRLLEKAEHINTLNEALQLDLEFYDCNGVPSNIQNYLNNLQRRICKDTINDLGLNDCFILMYNYSMTGYIQLLFQRNAEDRLKEKLHLLEEAFDLKITSDARQDMIVLNVRHEEARI